jgi:hypothetical protein
MNNAKSVTAPKKADSTGRGKRYGIVGLISLLLLLLVAWWLWPNDQVDKVRKMQEELFGQDRGSLSPEERKEKMDALRAERDKLSDDERAALKKEMGKAFMKKQNVQAIKYFGMTPAERQKVIDDRLAREQSRLQKQGQNGGGAGPKGNFGNGQGGPPGAGNGPPGGPRGALSAEERDDLRRQFLISASPEARAGMDQMKLDIANRRAEIGLPPPKGGRGF